MKSRVRLIWCPYNRACVGRLYDVWREDGDWLYARAIDRLPAEPANRVFLRSMVQPVLVAV